MSNNLMSVNMMPVENMSPIAKMFETGKTYEVIVDDKVNQGAKLFAFGLNGRIGEFPTNTKIRLKGEVIRHLYNCTYDSPIIKEEDQYRRVIGYQKVCRFSITPTSWGALPDKAVLLQRPGVVSYLDDATVSVPEANAATPEEQEEFMGVEPMPEKMGADVSVDDFMACREKELETMSKIELLQFASERGIKVSGSTTKATILGDILDFEQKLMEDPAKEE